MEYREIAPGELDRALFRHFERRQEVTKCRRRENGAWVVRDAPFIDDWSEADYAFLVQCLQNTLATGGIVQRHRAGAFYPGGAVGPCARRKKAVSVGPFGGGDTGVLRGDGLRGGPGVQ